MDSLKTSTLAEQRWIEPQLAASAVHGPCAPPQGPGAQTGEDRLLIEPDCSPAEAPWEPLRHTLPQRVSIDSDRERTALSERQITRLHAWAVLALVRGRDERKGRRSRSAARKKGAEEAVQILEALREQRPGDVRILNDLAAAYFVRAWRTDRPADLVAALDLVERAAEETPPLKAALFNRALLHETLGLRRSARRAWRLYLCFDPISGWAEEARRRLDRLHAPLDAPALASPAGSRALYEAVRRGDTLGLRRRVGASRAASRRFIEEELSLWATASAAGDAGVADTHLDNARQTAATLAAVGGDTLLAAAVEQIDRTRPELRSYLIRGHGAYGEAQRGLSEFQIAEAAKLFEVARQNLQLARSSFRLRAEVGLAICHYHREDYGDAIRLLETVRGAGGNRFPALHARASWILGTVYGQQPRPLQALSAYGEALRAYAAAGEEASRTNVHARLADIFASLGEEETAWRHRYQALADLGRLRSGANKAFVLLEASTAALQIGVPRAALVLQEEALHLARIEQAAVLIAEMLRHRAEVSLRLGEAAQAMRDLREATELADAFADENVRRAVGARILEVEGQARQEPDPRGAIESFTRALEQLPDQAFGAYRVELLLRRARVFRSIGHSAEAKRDLAVAIRELDAEWRKVLKERHEHHEHHDGQLDRLWAPYFDRWQGAFDAMVRWLVEEGQGELALQYAEMARARDLLDLVSEGSTAREGPVLSPLLPEEIRGRLAPGRILVEYVLLEDRVLIWAIEPGGARNPVVQAVPRSRVEAMVGDLHRYVEGDKTLPIDSYLRDLYALLIEPIEAELSASEELILVPDGVLHRVPFAALRSPRTGRYLIEDHTLAVSPSATFYIHTSERNRKRPRQAPRRAFLVGDPAFQERGIREGLKRLPAAKSEIRRISDWYPEAVLLQDESATKPRFLAELGRHQVLHFAGHAIPNAQIPSLSSLILAPSPDDDGILYAEEWGGHDLSATRLVVFSACSTAGGHPIGSLSTAGLVRPILGAGVPAVLGTLWDINSPTAQVLVEFHRFFSAGEDAATALRNAQLSQMRQFPGLIETWAAFQLIGTTSPLGALERSR